MVVENSMKNVSLFSKELKKIHNWLVLEKITFLQSVKKLQRRF